MSPLKLYLEVTTKMIHAWNLIRHCSNFNLDITFTHAVTFYIELMQMDLFIATILNCQLYFSMYLVNMYYFI